MVSLFAKRESFACLLSKGKWPIIFRSSTPDCKIDKESFPSLSFAAHMIGQLSSFGEWRRILILELKIMRRT